MTKKPFIACNILMAGLLLFGAAGLDAANAAPPPPGGAPTARILMINMRQVMEASKVGQDIRRQVELLKQQASKELNGEGAALKNEETQLQQQAAILAPDVKARRIKDFQVRATAFQQKIQKRGNLIQGGVLKAQQQIEQALGPILEGIMKERGATLLLDRSSILLAPNSIDVTQLVVQRLDMKMPTVKVEPTEPPEGMQQQQ
ncbi:MAG TPA: OmpH family outer membrane protein [Rhizomicrobium sp.]